ncbi:protein kinase domain-containing protein [Novipirellula sp. SH528]|uniref:protein kinase domain-containing protein n=1 Tax=Novipirellula sp. SH528 TaxID=3454466 RepID=UPI003F9F8989
MTNTQSLCSTPDHLLAFLRGRLSDREESDLQDHLDTCESCRLHLETTAADANAWREAERFLGDTFDLDSDDHSPVDQASQTSLQIEQVIQSLGPTDDPQSHGRIGGYEVTGVIGAGGMGVVLKAHERALDRIVAIKVMAPHLASSGSARKRFAREAKAAAAVIHPNVIAIHGVSNEGSLPYLVMPFVGGDSLQKRLDHDGPLTTTEVLRVGSQIAAGLAAAHGQGLVHRDIKPANILLDNGVERVSITDFGLARAVDDAAMTRTGVIAGTPQFMSPEQARGESIDHRSDLFSLGSVLYMMCTGRAPFRAETSYGVLRRITDDQPKPIREINADIPEWLCTIISKLMAKQASDRFDSAVEVAELLEDSLAHVQQPTTTPLPEKVAKLVKSFGSCTDSKPAASLDDLRRPAIGKFIAASAFAFSLIFAGILIVLELNKGTLTIECDFDDIPIRIMQGKDLVRDITVNKGKESIRIAAGNYLVEIDGPFEKMTVNNQVVSLTRGGEETVRIVHADAENETIVSDNSRPNETLSKTLQQLQGKWRLTQQILDDGDERSHRVNTIWEFKGDRMIRREGGPSGEVLIRVDESQTPVQFELIETEDRSGLGLLSVEGDKLRMYLGKSQKTPDPRSRPKKLQWVAGVYYTEFQRLEPAEPIVNVEPSMEAKAGKGSSHRDLVQPQKIKDVKAGIQGRWLSETFFDGFEQPLKERDSVEIEVDDAMVKIRVDSPIGKYPMRIHWLRPANSDPPEQSHPIDLTVEENGPMVDYPDRWKGIIQCDGDTLTLCFAKKSRPKRFHQGADVCFIKCRRKEINDSLNGSKIVDVNHLRTLDAITSGFNEQTSQLRKVLFDHPILDLTAEQMQSALIDTASMYRQQGKVEIALALESSVESGRLVDDLTYAGMSGISSPSFRQIAPTLIFGNGPGPLSLIFLSKAELRYSRSGWSSSTWGDIHPPLTGAWELVSVEQRGETLSRKPLDQWKRKHPNWERLAIEKTTLSMVGAVAETFDFTIVYGAGPLPQFQLSQDGNTRFAGVLMGNGFVDDTQLQIAVDLDDETKPTTFHTTDGVTTKLTYRRTRPAGRSESVKQK